MTLISNSKIIGLSLLGLMIGNQANAVSPQPAPASQSFAPVTQMPAQAAAQSFTSPTLQAKAKAYKTDPSETNWSEFSVAFKNFLTDARTLRLTPKQIYQSNAALTDLHAHCLDARGVKLWTFPGNKDNKTIFAQKVWAMPATGGAVPVDTLEYPLDISLSDARVLHFQTTTTISGPRGKKRTQVVEGPKFLAITGYKRTDGQLWLRAYKLAGTALALSSEPFQHVPASLLQGSANRAFFSGNQLMIGMPSTDASSNAPGTPVASTPSSSSYQVSFRFEGNSFVLADKPQTDGPLPIATFFVKTLLEGRTDIAKAWVSDPSLMNIPKYVGLIGKTPAKPYKLVSMTVIPGTPVMARYRLVTFESQDLIIDIGRVKKETKVKGIFVAPADPVARNLAGVQVGGPAPQLEQNSSPTNPVPVENGAHAH